MPNDSRPEWTSKLTAIIRACDAQNTQPAQIRRRAANYLLSRVSRTEAVHARDLIMTREEWQDPIFSENRVKIWEELQRGELGKLFREIANASNDKFGIPESKHEPIMEGADDEVLKYHVPFGLTIAFETYVQDNGFAYEYNMIPFRDHSNKPIGTSFAFVDYDNNKHEIIKCIINAFQGEIAKQVAHEARSAAAAASPSGVVGAAAGAGAGAASASASASSYGVRNTGTYATLPAAYTQSPAPAPTPVVTAPVPAAPGGPAAAPAVTVFLAPPAPSPTPAATATPAPAAALGAGAGASVTSEEDGVELMDFSKFKVQKT